MESISCPDAHRACDWCGAYPYEECKQPDLRFTEAARKPFQIDDAPMELLPDPPGLEEVIHGPPSFDDLLVKGTIKADKFSGNETVAFDDGKPDPTMVDPQFTLALARVLAMGAEKYERDNWRKGTKYQRRIGSAMRHIMAWIDGEDLDQESGLPHLAHAATNLMFVMNWQRRGVGTDDRFVG